MSLPAKQERFCQEYLIDLNATRAAIRAGYSARTANEQGAQLLAKLSVADRVAELMAERQERTRVTQDEVVRELALVSFSDNRHYVLDEAPGRIELSADAPPQAMRALQSVKHRTRRDKDGAVTHEAEYRLWSKTDALKTLASHLGMLKDVVVSGTLEDLIKQAASDGDGAA